MCGRYYVDDTTAKEIEKLAQDPKGITAQIKTGDVMPSQTAVVLREAGKGLKAKSMFWGFPRPEEKGLLINARAETALERHTFRESMRSRRCIIPAKGFYEWNREKEKYAYERKDFPFLFMAGCYNRYQKGDCFVILTTAANSSVSMVHDRMPLILEPDELGAWVSDPDAAEWMLQKSMPLLRSRTEYEQMNLFPF